MTQSGYRVYYFCHKVLQINFDQSDYTIIEGSATLSSPITLIFRQNQNPFTIMLSPVTVATAEAAGVGDFINADAITAGSRATGNTHLEFVCVYVCDLSHTTNKTNLFLVGCGFCKMGPNSKSG